MDKVQDFAANSSAGQNLTDRLMKEATKQITSEVKEFLGK
jgi:hypothetical protein